MSQIKQIVLKLNPEDLVQLKTSMFILVEVMTDVTFLYVSRRNTCEPLRCRYLQLKKFYRSINFVSFNTSFLYTFVVLSTESTD